MELRVRAGYGPLCHREDVLANVWKNLNEGRANLLYAGSLRGLEPGGYYPDGAGLVFCRAENGHAYWEKWSNPTERINPEYLGDYPSMSLSQARGACHEARSDAELESARRQVWHQAAIAHAEAPKADRLHEMKPPPWVPLAASELEATSAMFATEFAGRLYPRLVGAVSYEDQLAVIRQAFIETVEAP